MNIFSFLLYFWKEDYKLYSILIVYKKKKNTMQGRFVNLCYTMENHAIAIMMIYFGSMDHGFGTEVDRGQGGHE